MRKFHGTSHDQLPAATVVLPPSDSDDDDDDGHGQQYQQQQHEEHEDHFHLLGIDRQYDVSLATLKSNYRQLMTRYHPDKHSNKTNEQRQSIEQLASQITNAYEVLREPDTRATHLLDLVGHPLEEASSASDSVVGNAFLMSIMEARETIESTAPNQMRPLLSQAEAQIEAIGNDVREAFDDGEYASALKFTAQLKYWVRIQATIKEKMED